jgi:hypothetical protein
MPIPQLVYFLITLVLSVALAPKPPKPKPASLEDFDVPTADEDRPIPVVFGEIEITGANVLWYGDLASTKIKKGGLFGKSTVGFRYYMGMHFGLCHGPVDLFSRVRIAEKEAWTGALTDNADDQLIDKPKLFGGEKKEGGVYGYFDLMMGASDQTPNVYLGSVTAETPA